VRGRVRSVSQHPFRSPGTTRPDVLICAGLDPSGGSGLIADIRVVSELRCRPVGVATALMVQNTSARVATKAMGSELVRQQIEHLVSDIEIRAVKIGMVGSSEIAKVIGRILELVRVPVVWDTIIHPSRGDVRLADSLFGHAVAALSPRITVLTPDREELGFLTGRTIASVSDALLAGQELASRLRAAVLVKDLDFAESEPLDLLCTPSNHERLPRPRTAPGAPVQGARCALSSALAAYLANGTELLEACRAARAYVTARQSTPVRPGRGGPVIL
jgi:hydroxymethylpyrimidine/phosphomethylpyrimidine kinase